MPAERQAIPGKVLVLGASGNFGRRIALALARKGIPIIAAGRTGGKLAALTQEAREGPLGSAVFDVTSELDRHLDALRPAVVINTCGPFQGADISIARAAIEHGVHYIDLSDGRDFVRGFDTLDSAAKARGVVAITGASTVPALSSAVIEHFCGEFAEIESLQYGISPGQKTTRGLATTQAVLSYVGKRLEPFAGRTRPMFGWQDLYREDYPEIGPRWFANCDIPDLDLLPARYGIKAIRFSAGLEVPLLHFGLWLLSWIVRARFPLNLPRFAKPMLAASNLFDVFGTADGGMHIILRGRERDGAPHERRWFVIAKSGDGPQIPCVPAIILGEKLARGEVLATGAYPCTGLISLEEYMAELKGLDIRQYV